ncbi:MAG: lipid A export permease/ATP-binding protein MsbA [Magnetococcales bacterium]|nr:lipid A export permease/ATP-binding protein MsbA [Magnetococcales bacterium]
MSNAQLFKRFGLLVWPYRWYLLPAVVCMLVLAASEGAMAYLVKPILDKVFIEQNRAMYLSMPLIVILVFFVRGVANFFESYLMQLIGHKLARGIQVRLYGHLLTLELGYFLPYTTGSFISRIINDTFQLKAAATNVLTGIVNEGFTLIALVIVLFVQDWELALMALIGLPASAYLIYLFGRRMRRLSRRSQEMSEQVVTHLEETFSGLRVIKSFTMEKFEQAGFRHLTKKLLRNYLRTSVVNALSKPLINLITGVVVSGVILFGGDRVMDGQMTTGAFFSFLTALVMAYAPVRALITLNNTLQQGLAAAIRIFEVLDTKPRIADAPEARELPPFSREIRLEGVSFRYAPGLPEVLQGIDLVIRAGERVALVGRSGSGKTTLVNLIPRFFEVTGGSIRIDGVDIRQVRMKSLRRQMAMVTQETILFNDSVQNNIAYGWSREPQEVIERAAGAAQALDFIRELPEGFATRVGDRGIRLSGGQRQRLSIARSLLKDAPILILDEATSSLDSESELAVQQALDALMVGRTSLVIAHRLSTIRGADRIVVLKEGRIVEEGDHETLMAKKGEYSRLYSIQFREQAPARERIAEPPREGVGARVSEGEDR